MDRRTEIAPCGVFCGACPSYNKTCLGCPSENTEQKRRSKWGCKIRKCCYEEKNLDYCGYCDEFPCDIVNKKLLTNHKDQKEFEYRYEIIEDMKRLKEIGVDELIKLKNKEYTCPNCNGTIAFYNFKCNTCGRVYKDGRY